MWNRMPEDHKKRFNTIVFIVGPVLFIIAFILSIKAAQFVKFQINIRGIIFVFVGMTVVYILSAISLYYYIKRKQTENINKINEHRGGYYERENDGADSYRGIHNGELCNVTAASHKQGP